jgi:tripartite-type tricarboxylate transporter receptor subunit TctC
VTLVGYRGAAPALTDAIGGQIDGVCDSAASVSQAIDDKLVKGLVVGSTVRLATCPSCRRLQKPGFPISRRRAGTACSRQRARRLRSSRKLNAAAKAAVERRGVKKRFQDSLHRRARRQRAHA